MIKGYFTHIFKVAKVEYDLKFELFEVIEQAGPNKKHD